MKYFIVDDEELLDTVDEVLDYCIDEDYYRDDDDFDEWVNDQYDGVEINGYEYSAYDIISSLDDNNWSELKDRFCEERNENDRCNARYDLSEGEMGDEIEIQSYTVRLVDDDYESGDYDGDEETEAYLDEQKEKEDKEIEQGIMNIIQVIG